MSTLLNHNNHMKGNAVSISQFKKSWNYLQTRINKLRDDLESMDVHSIDWHWTYGLIEELEADQFELEYRFDNQ